MLLCQWVAKCGFDLEYCTTINLFSLFLVTGVISGALLYIRDEFEEVDQSSFLQVCN